MMMEPMRISEGEASLRGRRPPRNVVFAFAAIVSTGSAASTETEELNNNDVERCLALQSNLERLACYDEVHNFSSALSNEDIKGWRLQRETDDFSGEDVSFAALRSTEPNHMGAPIALILRCDGEGDYYTFVDMGVFLQNGDLSVRHKFDDGEVTFQFWIASTTGTAAFLPRGPQHRKSHQFALDLVNSDRLAFEVEDFQGSRHRAVFEGLGNNSEDRDFIMSGCSPE